MVQFDFTDAPLLYVPLLELADDLKAEPLHNITGGTFDNFLVIEGCAGPPLRVAVGFEDE